MLALDGIPANRPEREVARFQIQDFLAVPIFNSRLFLKDYFVQTC